MKLSPIPWRGILLILLLLCALPVWGAKPYKTYVIRNYEGWDILCDPYTVQKGDHIWEILRRRGCIAEHDFPRFIAILKHLNPHIRDINKIYPDQQILIPLKQMKAEEGPPGPDDRFITIPFIPDILDNYEVRPGDCVATILSQYYQIPVQEIPNAVFENVRLSNKHIQDIDRIHPGQTIRIPHLPPRKRSSKIVLAARLHNGPVHAGSRTQKPSSRIALAVPPVPMEPPQEPLVSSGPVTPPPDQGIEPQQKALTPQVLPAASCRELQKTPRSVVSAALEPLGGTLLESGHYFFPTKGKPDLKLDLSLFPVIELNDGRRLLLEPGKGLPEDMEREIRAFWKSLTIIPTDPGEARRTWLDKIFRAIQGEETWQTLNIPRFDDGIQVTLRGDWVLRQKDKYHCITLIEAPEERTSDTLRQYLAEKNIQVSDLLIEEKNEISNVTVQGGRETAERRPPAISTDDHGIPDKGIGGQRKAVSNTPNGQQLPNSEPVKSTEPIVRLLDARSQETFVVEFVEAIGYSYNRRVPLSFQYAGCQVQTVTNLIHGDNGLDAVVDFGTFYGEAKSAIEAGGLKVLTIRPGDEALTIAQNILRMTGIPLTEDPVFFGANREVFKTISLTIPGLLASDPVQGRVLLTRARLHPRILDFLRERKIKVLRIKSH
ncbi:MAG: LysM peptidoglycan-binding domain-containing protein [Deltaproteobacteria bacterium]|nr:LysM peptidoglycan-binding domain-containing protein [Deltaproteobacteria bacterium]MBW2075528.1 LysM peptidoglycan-binding domain-containing protein [Deltaproteobacteria bacterium]